MAEAVLMPKLGATMEEGTIINWLVEEGDTVNEGDPILEIMTDKVNLEVEAPASGVLIKQLYDSDTVVKVLKPIAFIGEAGEDISSLLEEADSSEESVDEIEEENTVAETVIEEVETDSSDEGLVRRTPA